MRSPPPLSSCCALIRLASWEQLCRPCADVISRTLLCFSLSIPPPFAFMDDWASGGLSWEVTGLVGSVWTGISGMRVRETVLSGLDSTPRRKAI